MALNSIITGIGSYIPTVVKKNTDFLNDTFYSEKNEPIGGSNDIIIEKFKAITGIDERRYVTTEQNSSDIAAIAAQKAIDEAKVDSETLDYIIFAQNFGDVKKGTIQTDALPSLASRVKQILKIENPECVAYDIIFGCPGWVQGLIQADLFIKAGAAKRCLVIGSETLSRVLDPHDRDSMIYSDGAGAVILEEKEVGDTKTGILGHAALSHTLNEASYLFMGKTNMPDGDPKVRYIKMFGRKIYEYALTNVPIGMKAALDKAGVEISQIKKIFIHQANEKMDEAIVKRFYKQNNCPMPEHIMPMCISKLGNSSVATVPTLLDLVLKNKLDDHQINKGDIIVLASVGGGMNINALVYKF